MVDGISYEKSTLLKSLLRRKKTNKALRVAFLDIDDTMTGSPQTTNRTRKTLEKLGYCIVFVTARTEEMLMTSNTYEKSKLYGFDRPAPLLGRYNGKHVYLPVERIESEGILDPDIIAGSTGTQILVKQTGGYYVNDKQYENRFTESSDEWRKRMFDIISLYNTNKQRAFPAGYEKSENYALGITDVYPPKYRIVLYFQTNKDKLAFRSFIRQLQTDSPALANNVRLTDDSNPKKERFVLCLTPKAANKTKAVDHIINQICTEANIFPGDLHVLIAGDSFPDIDMGMRGAKGTCATFLLAGGSRLTHALVQCKEKHEGFEDQIPELKSYLSGLGEKGYYRHQMYKDRNLIVCDEVCKGKVAAESILEVLPELEQNN